MLGLVGHPSSKAGHPSKCFSAAPGFFHEARERQKRASLVETGRHAGRSRVNFGGFRGVTLNYHVWKRGAGAPMQCAEAAPECIRAVPSAL